ncbi:MAG: sensor histidine kinase [Acidobacteriia bacterium]|nr:sensor histidine kinase [Terriglobia bacterium]
MHFWTKFPWSRSISWARVAFAAAALVLSYVYLPDLKPLSGGLMVLFLAHSLVPAVRGRELSGLLGLLALFGDTVYFLILASLSTDRLLWMASLFYLFLLAEALLFYTGVQLCVVAGACALFCAVLPNSSIRFLEPTVVVAGGLACALGLHKQWQNAGIAGLNERLKTAEKEAERARDQERQRIASDFHDGPLQSFISLQMRLEIVRKLLDRDFNAGMEDLRELQTLAQSQIRDLRAFLHSMRPVDVDGANLVATARRAAESFQKESGIPVTFLGTATPVGLPQEMTSEVLQMLRESLHNVQKHAGASRVAVSMEKTDRGLEISVDDNGHGFNFAGTYTLEELELLRLGPASLKRRARSLNADLVLDSRPGRGAGLRFRIPLQ